MPRRKACNGFSKRSTIRYCGRGPGTKIARDDKQKPKRIDTRTINTNEQQARELAKQHKNMHPLGAMCDYEDNGFRASDNVVILTDSMNNNANYYSPRGLDMVEAIGKYSAATRPILTTTCADALCFDGEDTVREYYQLLLQSRRLNDHAKAALWKLKEHVYVMRDKDKVKKNSLSTKYFFHVSKNHHKKNVKYYCECDTYKNREYCKHAIIAEICDNYRQLEQPLDISNLYYTPTDKQRLSDYVTHLFAVARSMSSFVYPCTKVLFFCLCSVFNPFFCRILARKWYFCVLRSIHFLWYCTVVL